MNDVNECPHTDCHIKMCVCVFARGVEVLGSGDEPKWLTGGLDQGGRLERSFNTAQYTRPHTHPLTCTRRNIHNWPKHTSIESLSLPYKDTHTHKHHRDLSSPQLVSVWQLSTVVNTHIQSTPTQYTELLTVTSSHSPPCHSAGCLTTYAWTHARTCTHTPCTHTKGLALGRVNGSCYRNTLTCKARGCVHSLLTLCPFCLLFYSLPLFIPLYKS